MCDIYPSGITKLELIATLKHLYSPGKIGRTEESPFVHLVREEGNYLEQANLYSPDRFERFRWPIISTQLDEKVYLLESDPNIRGCLYNHPLEVRRYGGEPMIIALERQNARFKTTRSRGSR